MLREQAENLKSYKMKVEAKKDEGSGDVEKLILKDGIVASKCKIFVELSSWYRLAPTNCSGLKSKRESTTHNHLL